MRKRGERERERKIERERERKKIKERQGQRLTIIGNPVAYKQRSRDQFSDHGIFVETNTQ